MSRPFNKPAGFAVPARRLSRLARLGSLASGVAGGMLLEGARQIAQGRLPRMSDFWHTPPSEALFLHRRLGGLYLLAAKFGARADVVGLLRRIS